MTKLNDFFERVFRRDIALPLPEEEGETVRILAARLSRKLTVPFFGVMFLLFAGLFAFHLGQVTPSPETEVPPPTGICGNPCPGRDTKGVRSPDTSVVAIPGK